MPINWEKLALIELPMKISVKGRNDHYILTSDDEMGIIASYYDANTGETSMEDVSVDVLYDEIEVTHSGSPEGRMETMQRHGCEPEDIPCSFWKKIKK